LSSLVLVILALCVFALAYRYYSAFLAAKVAVVDAQRRTPAHELEDGRDYVPTNRYVLFGHHFAAISGAGPLIGPVMAAQFGFAPAAIWLIVGAVLAGAVHDFMTLFASVRHRGLSLSYIARRNISRLSGVLASLAILFIITTALAGLAVVVVLALGQRSLPNGQVVGGSSWGTFTIAMTIPAALLVGCYLHKWRPGRVAEASAVGVTIVLAGVILGHYVPGSRLERYFLRPESDLRLALPIYGFIASVLPVWVLLCPRDYLSSYMKIGTIVLLALGIVIAHPPLRMPAVTPFIHGGGWVFPGATLWPYLCIIIMCGAISGFHALISSGTTPKMINSEGDIRFIGYGAMLVESFVGIMALIAACVLLPQDYYAVNAAKQFLPELSKHAVELPRLTALVGEKSLGAGGAVTLAVGMAAIFGKVPLLKQFMSYWYHFALMFEALFVLTAVDTGTRVARFVVQEFLGPVLTPKKAIGQWAWVVATSAIACFAWGYLLWFNEFDTIWKMFGVANQLLAGMALAVGTTIILRTRKPSYALVTFAPMLFVLATAVTAGIKDTFGVYLPQGTIPFKINAGLTLAMVALVGVVTVDGARVWWKVLRERRAEAALVEVEVAEPAS